MPTHDNLIYGRNPIMKQSLIEIVAMCGGFYKGLTPLDGTWYSEVKLRRS